MTRKSGDLRNTEQCFHLIGSHQQCIPWSPPLEIEPTTHNIMCLEGTYSLQRTQLPPELRLPKSMLWIHITLTSWAGNIFIFYIIKLSGRVLSQWLVNSASFMCDLNRWPSGRISASAFCGCWFDLQWWRTRYALLTKLHKIETTVPYVACRCLPDFIVLIIQIYIYVCVCMCIIYKVKFRWEKFSRWIVRRQLNPVKNQK